jgi:hypothetical protein
MKQEEHKVENPLNFHSTQLQAKHAYCSTHAAHQCWHNCFEHISAYSHVKMRSSSALKLFSVHEA